MHWINLRESVETGWLIILCIDVISKIDVTAKRQEFFYLFLNKKLWVIIHVNKILIELITLSFSFLSFSSSFALEAEIISGFCINWNSSQEDAFYN